MEFGEYEKSLIAVIKHDIGTYDRRKAKNGITIKVEILNKYKDGSGSSTQNDSFRDFKSAIKYLDDASKQEGVKDED